jgi:hypothetical protein
MQYRMSTGLVQRIVLMPGGILVPVAQLDRLPVLKSLAESLEGGASPEVTVPVPEDMVGAVGVVAEFLRMEPDEFVLDGDPEVAAMQRKTLDWLGVDVGVLRTAGELREKIRILENGAVKLMLHNNVHDCIAGGGRTWITRAFEMRQMQQMQDQSTSMSDYLSVLSEEARQSLFVNFNERDPEKEPEGYRMSREGEVLHEVLVKKFPWSGILR